MTDAHALLKAGREKEARAAMEEAALLGHPRAATTAGIWSLLGLGGALDPGAAADHLRRAASAGEATASFVLAGLAVSDTLGPRDWPAALGHLLAAAERGEARAATSLALLLDEADEARAALLHRAALGRDARAQYLHGARLAASKDAQERHNGLAWISLAAKAGEPCARRFLAAARTAPANVPPTDAKPSEIDWRRIPAIVRWPHERSLAAPRIERAAPRIASLHSFLTAAECYFLMSRGAPLLRRAQVFARSGSGGASEVRTNDSMKFGLLESDPLVQSIDSRVAAALGEPAENGERFALLRYAPGQSYAPHCDWIDASDPEHAKDIARWGQRIKTLVVYLNEDFEGGETAFLKFDWTYKGRRGDALIWHNVSPEGEIDRLTLHAGLTPTAGEKWLLSKWMRDRSQADNHC